MQTIQGVRTKVILVSFAHGAVRVPLEQSLNYTPNITQRTINEFDNLEAAEIVTTFTDVSVTFDYLDSDSKLVDAMFADTDPAGTFVVDDPSNYKMVNLFANVKDENTGKIFASILAKGCRAKGSPYATPVLTEATVTRDMSGTNVLKMKGAAIQYERITGASGFSGYNQAIPPNAYTDVHWAGYSGYSGVSGTSGYSGARITHVKTADSYSAKYVLYVLKNGYEATTGYTATATTFELTVQPSSQDIWEVFSIYQDV